MLAQVAVPATQVEFSLGSPAAVTQGEPILVNYSVRNRTDKALLTNFGPSNDEWYTLWIVDEKGISATPKTIVKPYPSFQTGYTVMEYPPAMTPNETRADTIVVTEFFEFPHPGKWTLTVAARVPASPVGPDKDTRGMAPITSITREFKFDLRVLPARPGYLRTVAEKWKETYVAEKDRKRRRTALRVLTSLPDSEAGEVWKALGDETSATHPSTYDVARAFGRIPSRYTADILADMDARDQSALRNSPAMRGSSLAGLALERMEAQAEGSLKVYIQSLLRRRQDRTSPAVPPSN